MAKIKALFIILILEQTQKKYYHRFKYDMLRPKYIFLSVVTCFSSAMVVRYESIYWSKGVTSIYLSVINFAIIQRHLDHSVVHTLYSFDQIIHQFNVQNGGLWAYAHFQLSLHYGRHHQMDKPTQYIDFLAISEPHICKNVQPASQK